MKIKVRIIQSHKLPNPDGGFTLYRMGQIARIDEEAFSANLHQKIHSPTLDDKKRKEVKIK